MKRACVNRKSNSTEIALGKAVAVLFLSGTLNLNSEFFRNLDDSFESLKYNTDF